jgi:hypothetical protein
MGNKQPMCKTHTHATLSFNTTFLLFPIPLSFSFLTKFSCMPDSSLQPFFFFFQKKDKEEERENRKKQKEEDGNRRIGIVTGE